MSSNEEIKHIQQIDIFSEEENWDSTQLKHMTNQQIMDCHNFLYKKLIRAIIELKDGEPTIMTLAVFIFVSIFIFNFFLLHYLVNYFFLVQV